MLHLHLTFHDAKSTDGAVLVRHLRESRQRQSFRVPVLEPPVLDKPEVVVPPVDSINIVNNNTNNVTSSTR